MYLLSEKKESADKHNIHGHLEVQIQTSTNDVALQQQQRTSSTELLSLYSQFSQHQTHLCSRQQAM